MRRIWALSSSAAQGDVALAGPSQQRRPPPAQLNGSRWDPAARKHRAVFPLTGAASAAPAPARARDFRLDEGSHRRERHRGGNCSNATLAAQTWRPGRAAQARYLRSVTLPSKFNKPRGAVAERGSTEAARWHGAAICAGPSAQRIQDGLRHASHLRSRLRQIGRLARLPRAATGMRWRRATCSMRRAPSKFRRCSMSEIARSIAASAGRRGATFNFTAGAAPAARPTRRDRKDIFSRLQEKRRNRSGGASHRQGSAPLRNFPRPSAAAATDDARCRCVGKRAAPRSERPLRRRISRAPRQLRDRAADQILRDFERVRKITADAAHASLPMRRRARRPGARAPRGRAASTARLSSSSELQAGWRRASSIVRRAAPYEIGYFWIRRGRGVLAVPRRDAPPAPCRRWPAKLTSSTGASPPRGASDARLSATARAPLRAATRGPGAPRICDSGRAASHASHKHKHGKHIRTSGESQMGPVPIPPRCPSDVDETPADDGAGGAGEHGATKPSDAAARNAKRTWDFSEEALL